MRTLIAYVLSILTASFVVIISTISTNLWTLKQAYANHCPLGGSGCAYRDWDKDGTDESTFRAECFYDAGAFGNCGNSAYPGPPGSDILPPQYDRTGVGFCLYMQDSYRAIGYAGITTACVNSCIEGARQIPRKTGGLSGGTYCSDPALDSPTSSDPNRMFCCTYTFSTPTPTPTSTPIPTPTPKCNFSTCPTCIANSSCGWGKPAVEFASSGCYEGGSFCPAKFESWSRTSCSENLCSSCRPGGASCSTNSQCCSNNCDLQSESNPICVNPPLPTSTPTQNL